MDAFVETIGWFGVILGCLGLASMLLSRDVAERRLNARLGVAVVGIASFAGARYGESSGIRWMEIGGLAFGYLATGLFLALSWGRWRSPKRTLRGS